MTALTSISEATTCFILGPLNVAGILRLLGTLPGAAERPIRQCVIGLLTKLFSIKLNAV